MARRDIFFTLPLELRDMIYFYTIMFDLQHRDVFLQEDVDQDYQHLEIQHGHHGCQDDPPAHRQRIAPVLYSLPALFFVSKQVRAEAEKVLYFGCTLVWRSPGATVAQDLARIPSRNRQYIRSVEYYHYAWSYHFLREQTLFDQISALSRLLPRLQKLTINLNFGQMKSKSMPDGEAVAKYLNKRLEPLLTSIPNVLLNIHEYWIYGDLCQGYPQSFFVDLVRHLRAQPLWSTQQKQVIWCKCEIRIRESPKIRDLENPIMLMGTELPARPSFDMGVVWGAKCALKNVMKLLRRKRIPWTSSGRDDVLQAAIIELCRKINEER
ncbi:MAG: hypothetical protein Q9224_003825 [Gallowayella concinna]